ncbi:MAG: uracil-DNA glycosylase family protein [Planctomycetota bacterium]
MQLTEVSLALADAVDSLRFGAPITHVYNPLRYAWESHREFLERYGAGRKDVLLIGMNPGPYGMAQTGVPFGEVAAVRNWLGIKAAVARPAVEHPKRPITGFSCARSEVSGRRLWGWARARFGTPTRFFARFFVHNYCPLVFMEERGANRTPDKLPASECAPLYAACDLALARVVECVRPSIVVGIGAFAEERARRALAGHSTIERFGRMLHPSPASPAANRGWSEQAERDLRALGIEFAAEPASSGPDHRRRK